MPDVESTELSLYHQKTAADRAVLPESALLSAALRRRQQESASSMNFLVWLRRIAVALAAIGGISFAIFVIVRLLRWLWTVHSFNNWIDIARPS